MTGQEIIDKLVHFKYWDTHQIAEANTFVEFAKRLPKNPTILETGTLVGKAACSWALATGGTVYTVEFNDNMAEIMENIRSVGLEGRVIPIRGDSTKIPWNKMVDVVWLDSNHDTETLLQELRKYSPFAKKLICGHDYNHKDFPEVKPTVDAWFRRDLDNPPDWSIWHKWQQPIIDIVSLFIGRDYSLKAFFEGLEALDYPKNRINLIWHDTSHIPRFSERLQDWLENNGGQYRSVTFIQCHEKHYHFEEEGDNAPKAMYQIVEAYNHCKRFIKGDYMLALEDDVVAPPDGLRRLLGIVKDDVKGACSLNVYRPSISRFDRQPIIWSFKRKEIFPGENIENGEWVALIWGDKFGEGVQYIGSGHLGFTLIDGEWLRSNKFEYNTGSIGGCDTILGFRMMQQGFKYAIDWGLKTKHYDIDGSYV